MLTLYYHPLACSLGAQLALADAGIPHEAVYVDLAGDRSAYRQINPLGTVPAIRTEAGVLTETTAIHAWLAQAYPEAGLLPKDPFGFAQGVSLLAWLAASAQPARRQVRMPARFTSEAACHAQIQATGRELFERCLQRIDGLLAGKDWVLGGDRPSSCDYQLMVYANWCALDGLALDPWPNFRQLRDRLLQRPAVRRVLEQIDSPLLKQA
ncbi:glutathione S-transferase family protein [Caldimonas thermodepolymerans]|jgi:glutathione S-transferase|uniref:Glutathione S-transferase n=1 Tax=Caldimonas thermodepolymerans TaxID=215580 RepID=A0A2S5T0A8_9BURK|nr:glutathione S-transferase family protein [Caldimonas thermodepolymerans]PPE68349.1 glutathione S-transferase [Caldimonas thermodepolymerans]QPC31216.1 glutathione S-transferase family protein [Caldimonas thermodepolymerans]RDH96676.1 glutathione S-transferase [Caldimonas thermodepolymerans]TCP04726.1 glutathione S-transferase [Caldimonas thermodepolymerans]UZG47614.1 glutathione S-transferase family protein [Caldimonas thermodepolymerans]